MSLSSFAWRAEKVLRDNSPIILTALGVSGTVTTAYLTGKASYDAAKRLGEESPYLPFSEKVERVWDLYVPAGFSCALTVGCIIGATRVSSKRAAAAASLLSVSERAFEEYRDKVVEKLGERKEKEARDEIAQEHINRHPPGSIIVSGSGNVLCCELYSGRYFNGDMEALRKAENDVNARLNREMYATLNDFYYLIGLPTTSDSGNLGWTSDKLMSLEFTTVLSEDGRPCLAFSYNHVKVL